MLLCINVAESELLKMSDSEKLQMVEEAYFRARRVRLQAENYDERRWLVRDDNILTQNQKMYVEALYMGLLD